MYIVTKDHLHGNAYNIDLHLKWLYSLAPYIISGIAVLNNIPYYAELWPISFKCLVLFSSWVGCTITKLNAQYSVPSIIKIHF